MGRFNAVGIDLGTTQSCVGVFINGQVKIIPNEQGNLVTPSYVAFTDEQLLIGEAAKSQISMNPTNTIFGKKILLHNQWRSEGDDLEKLIPVAEKMKIFS